MPFTSMDIIKNKKFEADFYVRNDNGIEIRDLTGSTPAFEIRHINDKTLENCQCITSINTDEDGNSFVKLNISSSETNKLDTIIEAVDDGYLHRSPYYGILTINNIRTSPETVTSYIDKINVIEG